MFCEAFLGLMCKKFKEFQIYEFLEFLEIRSMNYDKEFRENNLFTTKRYLSDGSEESEQFAVVGQTS